MVILRMWDALLELPWERAAGAWFEIIKRFGHGGRTHATGSDSLSRFHQYRPCGVALRLSCLCGCCTAAKANRTLVVFDLSRGRLLWFVGAFAAEK
jgi:hypothetical protein